MGSENERANGRKAWVLAACGLILLAIIGTGLLRWSGIAIPAALNPFGPPDLTAAPGVLTRIQLSSLKRDPQMCFQALKDAGISHVQPEDKTLTGGCGLQNGVRFTGPAPGFQPSAETTCALAAAYVMFHAHVVAPAAQAHFDQPVSQTLNFGTYACRQIRGGGRMSEHATANAIDIAGFMLADGTQISLLDDWDDTGAKGAFLRDVSAGSCRLFNVVLGPDDNAAHADHFHFDMGPFRRCRYD